MADFTDDDHEALTLPPGPPGVVPPGLALIKDKWRVEACLGAGGTATVYSATHRNGLPVAIKVLHPELAADREMRARFLQEAYAANRIRHPGVVRVLDDDVMEDGRVFLVMDLVEGESLGDRAERLGGTLPFDELIPMVYRVLDVLDAAHAKGIVHRDIKPDNVFLTRDGGIKVLDFGLARMKDKVEELGIEATSTGLVLGTLDFMSPEQARGDNDLVDPRSDLFAVGATAFTMITGQRVHSGRSMNDYLVAAATEQARSIATVATDLPAEIADVLDRALRLEPHERWSSAKEMQLALKKAYPAASRGLPGA
jgi:eukaryotic-like serine/threonine-protein kinase